MGSARPRVATWWVMKDLNLQPANWDASPVKRRIEGDSRGFGKISREGGWDRDGRGWTEMDSELSHRACDTWSAMKTAATIDVTVPENRKLELELPPEVPAGKAKLLVMVEEQAERRELPEATVESVDGRLRLVLPVGVEVAWEQVSVERSRDERTKKLLGMG